MDHPKEWAVSSRVIDEAADWLTRMHRGDLTDVEKNAWEEWLQQSAEHQRVWKSAQLLAHQFDRIESQLAMPVLNRPRGQSSRRGLIRTMGTLMVIPPATWFGLQLYQGNRSNRYRTATGERREIILADRSRVTLNTATELAVQLNPVQRLLEHFSGEIFIRTAPDSELPGRPFIVETEHGQLRALGTEFNVRQGDVGTCVSVFEGAVEVVTRQRRSTVIVEAGQQLLFTAHSRAAITPLQPSVDAWRNGILYAQGMRLTDFSRELARYRQGLLRCDPAVGDLRVTGAFRLADTDAILRLLANTLPVKINARTRYWVTINPL